jgi:hypothetical protein
MGCLANNSEPASHGMPAPKPGHAASHCIQTPACPLVAMPTPLQTRPRYSPDPASTAPPRPAPHLSATTAHRRCASATTEGVV